MQTQQAATVVAQQAALDAQQVALTQESLALTREAAGDDDGDGLSNEEEKFLNTNPNAADTDNDGINDFDEASRCTNPLVADTDGDGLSDGDEERRGLLPCIPDTDGDGIPDGIDPDALVTPIIPTTTPLVFPTPVNPVIILPTQPAPIIVVTQLSGGNSDSEDGGSTGVEVGGNQVASSGGGVPSGANLLPNPSFEGGHYNQEGIREFQLPVGWKIDFLEEPNEFGTEYYKPETGVLSAERLPPEEVPLFVFDGDFTLKIFKGGLPMRATIYSEIVLAPGEYEVSADLFPDVVVRYNGGEKEYATDPMAGNVRLIGAQNSDWLEVDYGQPNTVTHRFTVRQAQTVRVGIEFRTIYNYSNNGFFFDNMRLQVVQ